MLLMICKSSALLVVMTTRGEGAEARLKLVQRYDPRTHQRAANRLVQLLNADLSGDLEDKTLLWERMVKTYEEQMGQVFAEHLRFDIWLSNAPERAIKTHMLIRTDLVRWADFRQEMMSCTRALKRSAGFTPKPLDI